MVKSALDTFMTQAAGLSPAFAINCAACVFTACVISCDGAIICLEWVTSEDEFDGTERSFQLTPFRLA